MGDGGLEAGALDGVGAAVHPLQDAPVHELAQVTPYRLGRHPQVHRELADVDPPVRTGSEQDLVLTLGSFHDSTPLDTTRSPGRSGVTGATSHSGAGQGLRRARVASYGRLSGARFTAILGSFSRA